MARPFTGTLALLALTALAGCSGCGSDERSSDGGAPSEPTAAEGGFRQALPLIDALPRCDVSYRGLLLDMGSEAMRGRYRRSLELPSGVVSSDHKGSSWARIYDKTLELEFLLPEVSPVFVSLRGIGKDARDVVASLDGFLLGTLKLSSDEAKISTTRTTSLPVEAGVHTLKLRFRGRKKSEEPYAEIDWVRIGTPDELPRTYGAPTLEDVLAPSAQIGGVPHQAIALNAPGSVRCALRVPPNARLRASIGMRGAGSASAAIVVHQDDAPPTVLERVDVSGGEDARWSDLEVSLQPFASSIVTLELLATKTLGTGRLLFGDPVVEVPNVPVASTPQANAAVVVVLDGVERSDLPPWRETETPHLPTLNELAKSATIFHGHRGPSTLVAASMASLLTGLPPREHGLDDRGARLPSSVATLARIASNASVRAAMFTGVPMTFAPFGFGSDWDNFTPFPPNGGRLATAPIDDAVTWLADSKVSDEARPLLTVVHARGGHPPWDVTPTEAAKLPPDEYAGALNPRRAAQLLANYQGRHRRLQEPDRVRMRALYFTSLSGQDMALGKLIQELEDSGRWDSTLFIVTGDVASSRQSFFADGLDLDEKLLTLPLYVHFPGGTLAGTRVDAPTEVFDVTRTVMTALGLKPAPGMLGRDLAAVASGLDFDAEHLRVASTDERFAVRWGDYVLWGERNERTRLCKLSLDPTCAFDRGDMHPLTTQALFRQLAWFMVRPGARKPPTREPFTQDADIAANLAVWGNAPPEP